MNELTPEERLKIYEEEKARREGYTWRAQEEITIPPQPIAKKSSPILFIGVAFIAFCLIGIVVGSSDQRSSSEFADPSVPSEPIRSVAMTNKAHPVLNSNRAELSGQLGGSGVAVAPNWTPTPRSSFTLTDEDRDYCRSLIIHIDEINKCLLEFSNLCGNPQYDDDDWKIQMATHLAQLQICKTEAEALSPTLKFRRTQRLYLKAMDQYVYVGWQMPSAIDNRDAKAVHECAARIAEGTRYIHKTTEEFNAIKARAG